MLYFNVDFLFKKIPRPADHFEYLYVLAHRLHQVTREIWCMEKGLMSGREVAQSTQTPQKSSIGSTKRRPTSNSSLFLCLRQLLRFLPLPPLPFGRSNNSLRVRGGLSGETRVPYWLEGSSELPSFTPFSSAFHQRIFFFLLTHHRPRVSCVYISFPKGARHRLDVHKTFKCSPIHEWRGQLPPPRSRQSSNEEVLLSPLTLCSRWQRGRA